MTTAQQRWVTLGAYQACWWMCVLGAGTVWAIVGVIATLGFAVAQVWFADVRHREVRLVLAATALGLVVDPLLVGASVIAFPPEVALGPGWSPLWMVALWTAFGAALSSSLGFVLEHRARLVLFGLVGGPIAYLGGERLGQLHVAPGALSVLAIGAAWAMSMLLLGELYRRWTPMPEPGQIDCTRVADA